MLSLIEFSLTENNLGANSTKYNVEITLFNFHYFIIWGLGFGCINVKKYRFKFDENKLLMMLFLVTVLCCLPACCSQTLPSSVTVILS